MKLYFDSSKLQDIAQANHKKYISAQPFPHIVLDNILPEEALNTVLDEFPDKDKPIWKEYHSYHEGKQETQGENRISTFTSLLLYQLNSVPFLQFLETLTGIKSIISDPYFLGGGLHQIKKGGKLGIHADFNKHPKFDLDRRLNVLIYLNKDWEEEYGGNLELWDKDMIKCQKKILPVFNRMVVFSITDWAYHGHPEPLSCPDDITRKSIALYYYTNGRPANETKEGKRETLFMKRPDEVIPRGTVLSRDGYAKGSLKYWVSKLAPPILIDIARSLKSKQP